MPSRFCGLFFLKKIFMKDTIYKSIITVIDVSMYFYNCIMTNSKRLNDNNTGPQVFSELLIKILVCTMLGVHSPLFSQRLSYIEGKSWKAWTEVRVCVYLGQLTAIFLSAVAPSLSFFIVWNGTAQGIRYQKHRQRHVHHNKEKGAPDYACLEVW